MSTNRLPSDTDELVALAQAIATVLSEKREELGISAEFEVLLRVSIEAARYATDRYIAVLAAVPKSPLAVSCLNEARTKCNRTITHLRRHVARSIAQLCRYLDERELMKVARYVCWVAA